MIGKAIIVKEMDGKTRTEAREAIRNAVNNIGSGISESGI